MDFRHYIGRLGLKRHAFGSLRQISWPTFDWTLIGVGHETNDALISLAFGHFARGKFLRGTLASPQRWGIMKRALWWMPLIYSPLSRKKVAWEWMVLFWVRQKQNPKQWMRRRSQRQSQYGSASMVVSAQRMDGPEGYQCFSEFWRHRNQDPVLAPETFL